MKSVIFKKTDNYIGLQQNLQRISLPTVYSSPETIQITIRSYPYELLRYHIVTQLTRGNPILIKHKRIGKRDCFFNINLQ